MSLEKRINAFVQLGLFLNQFKDNTKNDSLNSINEKFYDEFAELILRQKAFNGWFTPENVHYSIHSIAQMLKKENLEKWLSNYNFTNNPQIVGVVMAGNIPLVGFHDLLCVLISGNNLKAKMSSNDNTLLKKICEILIELEVDFNSKIEIVERLENFNAVIATGSNNTARYFHDYFSKYPHIIRKNRNSVGIINEKDQVSDLEPLGNDVFQYFGLGCRNVSKLFIPSGYRLDSIFEAFYENFKQVTDNNKYANNYDYNKAVYLMGSNQLLDNGFLLLKEDQELSSPVGVLNYEYYNSLEELHQKLALLKEDIQCIVSSKNTPIETIAFGNAQCPAIDDYADGVDTLKFLEKLV